MTEIEAIGAIQNDLKWHSKELKPAYKEALKMAIKALEKQIPKKVAYQGEHEKCPSCGSFHVFGRHCTECGQAIDYE